MKIAQIVEAAGGGTGRHVTDLTAGLIGSGHQVTVIYSPVRAERNFLDRLEPIGGATTLVIPLERGIGLHDWRHLGELRRRLLEHGPFDILHGHSSKAGALVRLLPASVPGARAYTPHAVRTMDPTLPRSHRALYAAMEKMLSYRPGRFVSGSFHEIAALRRLGVPDDRIDFLQFGIDRRLAVPRDVLRHELGLQEADIVVGFVGRLVWQKAPERAIAALSRLRRREVTLAIIGEGEMEAEIRALADAAGLGKAVRFLGYRDGERVMPAFDVLLMPSRYESSPYVLLEALMAEVPVVTTPIGMAEQLLEGGRAGRLVRNTDDPGAWVDALASLLEPAALDLAKAEARSLRASISLGTMIRQIESIYERAIAAPSP